MARMKNGPYGPIVGKIGNTVTYIRLGQPVIRTIGSTEGKPSTPKQIAARARFAIVSDFINEINAFTNVGFKPKAKATIGKTAQNMAMSANLKTAVDGEYPDYQLNYSRINLSEGKISLPDNISITLAGSTLKFSWDVNPNWDYQDNSAQVMMLAYFPDTKHARYITSGARKLKGTDELMLFLNPNPKPWEIKQTAIQVYIAFVSEDRENTSNSAYLGRIELD